MRTIPQSEIDYIESNRHSSLNAIAKELNRSRSTISKYLKRTPEEHAIIVRASQSLAGSISSENIQNKGIAYAEKLFETYKLESLFLVGLALYWAEGRKTGSVLSIANSDPRMIKIFYLWVKKYLSINIKMIMRLQFPVGSNSDQLSKYWASILPNIEIKTVYYGRNTKTLNGVCNLELSGIRGTRTFRSHLLYLYCTYLESIAV